MITFTSGPHSSEKDHTAMTGGTLSVDKHITADAPLTITTYTLDFFPFPHEDEYLRFHAGMHTNEHLLAYTRDTGSLRSSLAEYLPALDTRMILDISPFQTKAGYGFRITTLVELDTQSIRAAVASSIQRALSYIGGIEEGHGDKEGFLGVPFATAQQCGQFTFHDPHAAQESLAEIDQKQYKILVEKHTTSDTKAVVCDLRLLKPKTHENDTCLTLEPKFSYRLSETLEQNLRVRFPGKAVIVGTFGCMTGMYLCITCTDATDEEIRAIHREIMITIENMSCEQPADKIQQTQILENYRMFGG